MTIAYVTVTILAATAAAASAIADLLRPDWLLDNMRKYGVPEWTLLPLAAIKLIGAVGLLIGLAVPPIALAAAAGLTVYFLGAVITVTAPVVSHARCKAAVSSSYRRIRIPFHTRKVAGSIPAGTT